MDDFERMYQEYFPSVYRFALGLSRDASLAEEIAQETFFRALSKIDDFRGECALNSWLCQIAKNLYFSHMRKHGRLRTLLPGHAKKKEELAPGEALIEADETKALHENLHALTEPYKEVFTLRIFAELGFREIAALFGKTESWARVTYYRAKRKLQERMEGLENE